MPKMKTRKCVAKRIKQTATGKFVRKLFGRLRFQHGSWRNAAGLLLQCGGEPGVRGNGQ